MMVPGVLLLVQRKWKVWWLDQAGGFESDSTEMCCPNDVDDAMGCGTAKRVKGYGER